MWERSFPPNNHHQRKYVVKYLPHCKFAEFEPPIWVGCGSTKWALIYSRNRTDAVSWSTAVKQTQHTGAFEWWFSEDKIEICPRYIPLPSFTVRKSQTVSEALADIGLFPSRTLAKVTPWADQPLFIRDFWCAVVGDFLGMKTKMPVEYATAMRKYINQFIPTQWLPKFQHVPYERPIYPAATNGIFLRNLDLCLSFAFNGDPLWTADTRYVFDKMFIKFATAALFRAPWIKFDREKMFRRYLCETICEHIWYDVPKPKTSIPYQSHILPRLFNETVLISNVSQDLQLTGRQKIPVVLLDAETLNFGAIRDDIYSKGVRVFKYPTTTKCYPFPLSQTKRTSYLCNPPFRKATNKLVDPNYIEIQGPIPISLQELRIDYPVLPLIPKKCYNLVKCLHAVIWDCEFMTKIPWCSVNAPVVFSEGAKYYMLTAYCLLEPQ